MTGSLLTFENNIEARRKPIIDQRKDCICNECFEKQKLSKRYYCEHNQRLVLLKEGYWDSFRRGDAGQLSGAQVDKVVRRLVIQRSITTLIFVASAHEDAALVTDSELP